MRTVICGGPKTGKTTLSQKHLAPIHHNDDCISAGWSEASGEIAHLFDCPGPWTIEGVASVRALRKWLKHNRGKPCDQVLFLTEVKSMDGYTPRHASMAKGVHTVFEEIEGELLARGVEVIRR